MNTKTLHREAEPLIRRALPIFVRILGTSHTNTETVARNYRSLLSKQSLNPREVEVRSRELTG